MQQQDYHRNITADITPEEAFDKISRVSEWWAGHVEGKTHKLNDIFTVRFGDTFVTFKITEVVPDEKIVWQVTDCYLSWLDDKKESNGTRRVSEISSQKNSTQIAMTHV